MRGTLETFYAEEFPKLRRLTQPIPGAVDVVKTVLGRGYRVAIATNPLFPRAAVLHRLEWAGLPVDEFPFALVPSFHAFHFSKPNPSFYSELLGKLAWPEGPVVMVGDSFTNDISPAMQAGLATYWVTGGETTAPEHQPAPTGRGALASLFPWLDATPAERLLPNYSSPAAILATLRATPAFFHCLGTNLSREAWVRRPSPGEWSAIEILCHLVDMDAEVNLPRMHKIVNDKNPFLAGMDTDAWAEARQYIQRDGLQAFSDYVTQRQGLVAYLESLPAEAWQRKARHAIFGPTSLREIASFAASHDRLHVRQIFQTLPTYECI